MGDWEKLDKCLIEIATLEQKLKDKNDKIAELEEHVLALETEAPLQNEKRRLDSTGQGMSELQKLKEVNKYLKAKIESLELHEDFHIPLEKRQHESSISGETNQLMKMLEEKLSYGLNETQTNVKKHINDKFNTMPRNNT